MSQVHDHSIGMTRSISRDSIYIITLSVIFILSLITPWYFFLVTILTIVLTTMLLDRLGRSIVLREVIALHGCFICLFMPMIGYLFYDQNHSLSRLWVKYMALPKEIYFDYTLPAVAGFSLSICWPLGAKSVKDHGFDLKQILTRAQTILPNTRSTGVLIMVVGVLSFAFSELLPVALQFAFSLLFFASFAGFLYVYFTPKFKHKILVLTLFAIFIFGDSLRSGMFTIVAYMSVTIASFFFVEKQIRFFRKILVFALALFILFAVQSVKLSFRQATWRGNFEGNKIGLFFDLLVAQVSGQGEKDISETFFPIYVRGNQGINIVSVMRRIPSQQEFDGGKVLFTNILSSFVPRIFWPDKPEAGGKFNMMYFAGYRIEGWSTNIGPIGEAYGSFGIGGGIIYMFILGWFIRWAYSLIFKITRKVPLLIFWLPVLFYQITYSAESDTLQILNSLIKSSFFVFLLYKLRPEWFGVKMVPVEKIIMRPRVEIKDQSR